MPGHFDYECDICSDFFDDDDRRPLIGNCGHTVCMTCVDNLRSSSGSATTKCPVCNTSHAFKIKVVNFQLVEFMKRSKTEPRRDSSSTAESSKAQTKEKTLECSGCGMVANESRMAVCETCGVGSKVLEVDANGSAFICNQLKLKKVVLCGCCIFEKHRNHMTVGLLSVELHTLAREFYHSCITNIEEAKKQSNNTGYWMKNAVNQIYEHLKCMPNKEDAKLVSDVMIKIVHYTKPISAIVRACEEEYERSVEMSSLWLDEMCKFLRNENSSAYSSKWTEMRKVLEGVIDNLEEHSEGKQWDHIQNLILHEKNHPLPPPPYGEASFSQYSHY